MDRISLIGKPMNQQEDCLSLSPFNIDFILKEILDFLEAKDLQACRLVSSHWHQMATPLLKKKHLPIAFYKESKDTRHLRRNTDKRKTTNPSRIQEFCALMKSSSEIPFTIFKLVEIPLETQELQEFFTDYSEIIKTLILDLGLSSYTQFKMLFKTLKSLEFLDIDELRGKATFSGELSNPTKVANIMKDIGYLNLQKVTFPADREEYGCEFFTIIFKNSNKLQEVNLNHENQSKPILNALKMSQRISQLTSLRLEFIKEEDVEILLKSQLSVSEFKFNILSNKVPSNKLEKLLQKLSVNLKHLAMGSPSDDSKMVLKFPKMPKLRNLGLFNCDDSLFLLNGIDFCRDTPSLQSLQISCGIRNFDWKEYFSVEGEPREPCLTVRELSIGILVSDPECVGFLGRVFPNVKRLCLDFPRKDFLYRVWSTWKDVEDLNLYFHVNDKDCKDRSVCGISDEWKEQFQKQYGTPSPQLLTESTLQLSPIENGVWNFKNLMRLTIEESPKSKGKSDLTDFSGYFALSKLKNLRVLRIGQSCISRMCVNYLSQELPMLSELDVRNELGPGVFSPVEQEELLTYTKYYEDKGYTEQE